MGSLNCKVDHVGRLTDEGAHATITSHMSGTVVPRYCGAFGYDRSQEVNGFSRLRASTQTLEEMSSNLLQLSNTASQAC